MKTKIVLIVFAVLLFGLIGFRIVEAKKAAKAPAPRQEAAVVVTAGQVEKADVMETVTVTGSVKPRNEVDVFAKVGGRIEQIAVDVGAKVQAGALLASVEHNEIGWQAKAAQAQVQIARAGLEGAKLEFDRTEALHKGGAAPASALDGARVRLTLAQAQVAQAEASAGLAEQQVSNSRIVSPIAGTVTRRLISLGAQVGPQMPVFTVQDLTALKMDSSLDASEASRVKRDQQVRVTVDALPDRIFQGKVTIVSPALDPATRRAAIEVQIENTNGELLPYMFGQALIQIGKLEHVPTVPAAAVRNGPGGAVVFVIDGNKVHEVKPVLGPTDGDRTVVRSGLNEGDKVAVGALAQLSEGAEIKVAGTPANARTEVTK